MTACRGLGHRDGKNETRELGLKPEIRWLQKSVDEYREWLKNGVLILVKSSSKKKKKKNYCRNKSIDLMWMQDDPTGSTYLLYSENKNFTTQIRYCVTERSFDAVYSSQMLKTLKS